MSSSASEVLTSSSEVQLVELLMSPETFDGQRVRTAGVLVMSEGGGLLFPSYAAVAEATPENSIWLSGDFYHRTSMSEQPVRVEGVFQVGRQGHLGWSNAGLQGVKEVVPDPRLPAPAPMWQFGPTGLVQLALLLLVPLVLCFRNWMVRGH